MLNISNIIICFLYLQFVLLMFESILIFSPESSLLLSYSRAVKANIHGYVMALSAILALGGFLIIYYNKNIHEKPHFTSWHGFFGVVTLGYISLQVCGGIFLKYNGILSNMLKIRIRLVDLKLYHATSGLVAFTLVCTTVLLGLWSDWFVDLTHYMVWYICFACLSCISMAIMLQITTAYLPKSKQPLTLVNTYSGRQPAASGSQRSQKQKKRR